jgi:hypothetical protein
MKPDLERAVGLALGAQAEYLMMASEAEDKQAKQVFDAMAEDLDRHVKVLRSRQEYLQKWGPQLQKQQAMAQQAATGQQGATAQQPMQQQMAQGGAQGGTAVGTSGAGGTGSGGKG